MRWGVGVLAAFLCALAAAGQRRGGQLYSSAPAAALAAGSLLVCGAAVAAALEPLLYKHRSRAAVCYVLLTAALAGCAVLHRLALPALANTVTLLASGFGLAVVWIALGFAAAP